MIVITSKPGQLGNSLWLYAHFIAFAAENKIKIYNPAFEQYAKYYSSTSKTLFYPSKKTSVIFNDAFFGKFIYHVIHACIRIIIKFKIKNDNIIILRNIEEIFDLEDNINIKKLKKKIIFVKGWLFQANLSICQHKKVIIDYFTPKQIYQKNINNLINIARSNADILIGLHIRQGDYKSFKNGKYFYESKEYIIIMNKVLELFPDKKIHFLICSETPQNPIIFSKFIFSFGLGHMIEDIYSLAQCDYIVGPPSTFSMWASYYGNVPLLMIKDLDEEISINEFKICNG